MVVAGVVFEEEDVKEVKEEVEIEEDQMKRNKIGYFCAITAESQVIRKLIVVKSRRMKITKQVLQKKMTMRVSCLWPFIVKKKF